MQDKELITEIARQKAGGSPSSEALWRHALDSFPDLFEPGLRLLLDGLHSPDATRMLGRFIAREPDPATSVRQFLREVDESSESLEEWLKAFEVFAFFIESTAHRPSLTNATGYLHCCAAASGTGTSYSTFPLAVETMLESAVLLAFVVPPIAT